MSIADGGHLKVVPGQRQGAGNGLFTTTEVEPYSPLFILPATAKMNVLTLKSHYPDANDLTAVQKITMHLFLHQPSDGGDSQDPLFGPYISVLPRDFDSHPLSWLIRTTSAIGGAPDQSCAHERSLLSFLTPSVQSSLAELKEKFRKDWDAVSDYLCRHRSIVASLQDSMLPVLT